MDKSMTFVGFPEGKNNPYVPVPEVFFTRVLPEIEDNAELKVTLHLFWLLAKKRSQPRCISDRELYNDRVLMRSLHRSGDPRPAEEWLCQGLALAVARGTLLCVHLDLLNAAGDSETPVAWYFFNTPRNQKVIAELEGGQMVPAHLLMDRPARQEANRQPIVLHRKVTYGEQEQEVEAEVSVANDMYARPVGHEKIRSLHAEIERPNIFVLYEQNIGLLTPLIAEELKDAARQFPMEWIEAAFREAVSYNKRKWSYIRAILRRWETEGRQQWNA